MKKSLALVLFGALVCNCALAETATTTTSATGNIIFSGHVDRGAAVVMVKTSDDRVGTALADATGTQIVVPSVKLEDLHTNGLGTPRDFYIELEGYNYKTAGVMTATVALNGTCALENSTDSIYKNEVTGDEGARNVGIQLRYKGATASGSPQTFTNNETITSTFDNQYNGGYSFHFDAALYALNKDALTSGAVRSTVNVTVAYK